jgi:hypothetical protein
MPLKELNYKGPNLNSMTFHGEVACIQQMHFCLWQILLECLCARCHENLIILPPDCQQRHLALFQPRLPRWILVHVRPVVIKQVQLDVFVARAIHQVLIQAIGLWSYGIRVWCAIEVLRFGAVNFEKRADRVTCGCGVIAGPEHFDGVPECAEAFDIGISVLTEDSLHFVGFLESKTESGWRAIVEDVDAVFLGWVRYLRKEGRNGGGYVAEVVGVVAGHRCETKAWKVGGNDAVLRREDGDEVAELVRGGREAVEEENGGRTGEASGAVEDGLAATEGQVVGDCFEEDHGGGYCLDCVR